MGSTKSQSALLQYCFGEPVKIRARPLMIEWLDSPIVPLLDFAKAKIEATQYRFRSHVDEAATADRFLAELAQF